MQLTTRSSSKALRLVASVILLMLVPAGGKFVGMLAQFPGETPPVKGPWQDKTKSPDERADLLIAQMTLDEKISLLHGGGWMAIFTPPGVGAPSKSLGNAGFIPGVPRLGIPDLQMADAAVGVTHGSAFGRYCTVLPSAEAEAASWNVDIARDYGALIGRELRDQGYTMSLGGGIDLAREPRNGRIFEYKGEDPILAGTMVGAEMKALQAEGVMGDIKHYAMNDQENGRSFVDVIAEKRAMRESDLLAFEIGVKQSGVAAVMCSYNLVNHDYACENNWLLNDVLKKDFGFQGFVISDWGGTHSTVKAVLAGLDMQMPQDNYLGDALKKAVEGGQVPASRVDNMVHRILRSELAVGLFDRSQARTAVDPAAGLEVAEHVAEQGTVLLRNANGQLPLDAASVKSIAVIGSHADVAVLSGGGSAQVDPPGGNAVQPPGGREQGFGGQVWDPSSPLRAIRARAPNARVEYNAGTEPSAAANLAKSADVAVVFVNQHTSEGRDVPNLSLPNNQDALVSAVAAANPRTVVVLETGGAVTMPWINNVSAVLEAWYPGIRGAEAITGILFGDVNPSGKLPLTFPRSEQDLPHPKLATQPPPGPGDLRPPAPGTPWRENTRIFEENYGEGLKVGYKWYDTENREPLFPFGYGLSYASYAYSDLKVTAGQATGETTVAFEVKNTGSRPGEEVAQVYAGLPTGANEPPKRLVAWQKVQLAAGESKTVTLTLDPHYLSVFDTGKSRWELPPGEYQVLVGGSSRQTPLHGTFSIRAAQ